MQYLICDFESSPVYTNWLSSSCINMYIYSFFRINMLIFCDFSENVNLQIVALLTQNWDTEIKFN